MMNAIPVRFSRNHLIKVIAFFTVILLLLACTLGGALQSSGPDDAGPDGSDETEVPGGGGGEGDLPPDDPPEPPDEDEPAEPEEEGDTDPSDPLVCPVEVTTYELTASHAFWTDTGMGLWNWEASGGGVILYIEGPEIVGGPAEGTFTGRQYGAFADGENQCSFEAPATIQVSVFGTCQDGVVTLNITEDWQMGTYTWICPNEDDEPDIAMFNLPSFGSSVHPDLVFKFFGDDHIADTVEIPWFGEGGGTKSWTLVDIAGPIE